MRREQDKTQLLHYIDAVSFAQYEAALFLDTHPYDQEALEYFHHYTQQRNKALHEYSQRFGPLTFDSACGSGKTWSWVETPFPWEYNAECNNHNGMRSMERYGG